MTWKELKEEILKKPGFCYSRPCFSFKDCIFLRRYSWSIQIWRNIKVNDSGELYSTNYDYFYLERLTKEDIQTILNNFLESHKQALSTKKKKEVEKDF